LRVKVFLFENIIDVGTVAVELLGKPRYRATLLFEDFSDFVADMRHFP